jgi:hypothetical protein
MKHVSGSVTGGEKKDLQDTLTGSGRWMALKRTVSGTVESWGISHFLREGAGLSFFQVLNKKIP